MAFVQYLKINDTSLPLPDSYDISFSDVEADAGGETEAGTIQRDLIRSGIISISVSFHVSPEWLGKMTHYSKQDKLSVEYFDTEKLELRKTEMFMKDFNAKLYKDTSFKGLWTVAFKLQEY